MWRGARSEDDTPTESTRQDVSIVPFLVPEVDTDTAPGRGHATSPDRVGHCPSVPFPGCLACTSLLYA